MDLAGCLILIGIGGMVIAFIFITIKNTSEKRKDIEGHFDQIKDFSPTQRINDGSIILAIDKQRSKICLVDHRQPYITSKVFLPKDLISSKIVEDGETVTKTIRSSQLGGALVGSLALGGMGTVIGGLSGKTQTIGKVNRIDLELIVNDTKKPLYDINFLKFVTEKRSVRHKRAIRQARHWHGLIEVLIKNADIEDRTATNMNSTQNLPSGSIADELKKIAELRDAGVLNGDEFQQQKQKLLEM